MNTTSTYAPATSFAFVVGLNTPFDGPVGLRDILVGKKRDVFVENFTERLLTYALGRGVEEYDHAIIRKITRDVTRLTVFSSSDPSIADVSPSGMVEFKRPGEVAVVPAGFNSRPRFSQCTLSGRAAAGLSGMQSCCSTNS